jgi:hypothetical protein
MERRDFDEIDDKKNKGVHSLDFMIGTYLVLGTLGGWTAPMISFPMNREQGANLARHCLNCRSRG